MQAPAILNSYPMNEKFGRIPSDSLAAVNLLLTDRERRLFTYYACQKSGFAPAGKTVELHTGISPKHLSAVRKGLIRKGFISYRKEEKGRTGQIEILWPSVLERSKMLVMSAQAARDFPEPGGRIYPRDGKKQMGFQMVYPGKEGITDIYSESFLKPEKKISQLFQESGLRALSTGMDPQPVSDAYYENHLDLLEDCTESQLESWMKKDLDQLPF